jgi:hypothetical protein
MEYYEMFENITDDFNVFSNKGFTMHHIGLGLEKFVEKVYMQRYMAEGWKFGELPEEDNV